MMLFPPRCYQKRDLKMKLVRKQHDDVIPSKMLLVKSSTDEIGQETTR